MVLNSAQERLQEIVDRIESRRLHILREIDYHKQQVEVNQKQLLLVDFLLEGEGDGEDAAIQRVAKQPVLVPEVSAPKIKSRGKSGAQASSREKSRALGEAIDGILGINAERWWTIREIADRIESAGLIEESNCTSPLTARIGADLRKRMKKTPPIVESEVRKVPAGVRKRLSLVRFFRLGACAKK